MSQTNINSEKLGMTRYKNFLIKQGPIDCTCAHCATYQTCGDYITWVAIKVDDLPKDLDIESIDFVSTSKDMIVKINGIDYKDIDFDYTDDISINEFYKDLDMPD